MTNIKDLFELFRSKSQGGKDFEDKHVVHTTADANGNDDEVFKGSKVKAHDRKKTRQGYNPGEDEKVYEEVELEEGYTIRSVGYGNVHLLYKGKLVKKFADPRSAQLYIAKADKGKKVEEEVELSELSKDTLKSYIKKAGRVAANLDDSEESMRATGDKFSNLSNKKMAYRNADVMKAKSEKRVKGILRAAKKLKEDQIIEAIAEMAEIEGVELDEETFDEMVQMILSENEKPSNPRDLFIENYVKPSQIPLEERLEESLSDLTEANRLLLLNLYEDLDARNRAILLQNLDDADMINNFIDFALSNRNS